MADEPQKVIVQASRVDDSMLPPIFSLAYRLYVIQQSGDLKNVADASNNANDLAYQATVKNDEQDVTLANHESRITTSEQKIAAIEGRVTAVEGRVTSVEGRTSALESDVAGVKTRLTTVENSVSDLQTNKASKTEALLKADNLSGLANVTTARTNLGLGDAAVKNTGTAAGTLAAGNDARFGTVDGKSGGTISSAVTIQGQLTVQARVNATGISCRAGSSGSMSGNVFNINWTSDGRAELYIDNARIGYLTVS